MTMSNSHFLRSVTWGFHGGPISCHTQEAAHLGILKQLVYLTESSPPPPCVLLNSIASVHGLHLEIQENVQSLRVCSDCLIRHCVSSMLMVVGNTLQLVGKKRVCEHSQALPCLSRCWLASWKISLSDHSVHSDTIHSVYRACRWRMRHIHHIHGHREPNTVLIIPSF